MAWENVPTFPVPEHMDRPRKSIVLAARRVPINIRATETDVAISHPDARHTAPVPEEIARMLTWGADKSFSSFLHPSVEIAGRKSPLG